MLKRAFSGAWLLSVVVIGSTAHADIYGNSSHTPPYIRVQGPITGADGEEYVSFQYCTRRGAGCTQLGDKAKYKISDLKDVRAYHHGEANLGIASGDDKMFQHALDDAYIYGKKFNGRTRTRQDAILKRDDDKLADTIQGFKSQFDKTLRDVTQKKHDFAVQQVATDRQMAIEDRNRAAQDTRDRQAHERRARANAAASLAAARRLPVPYHRGRAVVKVPTSEFSKFLRARIKASQRNLQALDQEAFGFLKEYAGSGTRFMRRIERPLIDAMGTLKEAVWDWAMRQKDAQARKFVRDTYHIDLRERTLIGDLSGAAPETWGPFDLRTGVLHGIVAGRPYSYDPLETGNFNGCQVDWGVQEYLGYMHDGLAMQVQAILSENQRPKTPVELGKAYDDLETSYRNELRRITSESSSLTSQMRITIFGVDTGIDHGGAVFETNIAESLARAQAEQSHLKALAQLYNDSKRLSN